MTKPTKWHVHPAKIQISLGICPVWSVSSLFAWRKFGSLANHWVHSEDSDQPGHLGRCPGWSESLLGANAILLVLSWDSSFTSIIQTSGVWLSPSTGTRATLSTHSCIASVMWGTTVTWELSCDNLSSEKTCLWGLRPSTCKSQPAYSARDQQFWI